MPLRRRGWRCGVVLAHATSTLAGAFGALCCTHHRDGHHGGADPGCHGSGLGSYGLAARRGQSGRGHAFDDSTGVAGGGSRLSALRLAAHGAGHWPLELFAGDLVLHQLCWSRLELVGCSVAAVRLLLLWNAAAAWPAALGYAGRAGCRHSGAGAGVGALCTQRHWAVMNPWLKRKGLHLGASRCNRHHDRCPGDIDSSIDVSVTRKTALDTDKRGLTIAVLFRTVTAHMTRPRRVTWVNQVQWYTSKSSLI